MSDVTPMRIGPDTVVTDAVSVVTSPYDGHEVGRVPVATHAHIDAAVAAATARREQGPLPAWQRAEILDLAARRLAERHEEFARRITEESAKPITTARGEVSRGVDTLRFSAAVARTLTGETVPLDASSAGEHKLGFVLRVPIGVVAAISPFNFPVNLVLHKLGPAIAAGCPVVLKPASATPLSALALAEMLLDECGLPDGWLNVITTSGSVANHLVEHPDVAMITFTGSPEVGWGIRGRVPHKRVGLELGNNAPVIVDESRRPRRGGGQGGRRRHLLRRPELHLGAAGLRRRRGGRRLHRPPGGRGAGPRRRRSVVPGDPGERPDRRERDGEGRGVDRRGRVRGCPGGRGR